MKATCRKCNLTWQVSIFVRTSRYVCPYCAVKREDAPNTIVGKPSKVKILERNQAKIMKGETDGIHSLRSSTV